MSQIKLLPAVPLFVKVQFFSARTLNSRPKDTNLIEKIIVDLHGTPLAYTAGDFLELYGKPGDILLQTFARYPGDIPFVVDFYYPNKGIDADYGQFIERVVGNPMILGCLEMGPILYLTTPQKGMSFQDYNQLFGIDIPEGEPYRTISEVTDMTVDTFYLKFKGTQQAPCVETPAKFWPVIP